MFALLDQLVEAVVLLVDGVHALRLEHVVYCRLRPPVDTLKRIVRLFRQITQLLPTVGQPFASRQPKELTVKETPLGVMGQGGLSLFMFALCNVLAIGGLVIL